MSEVNKIAGRAVTRVNAIVIRDVITIIAIRRGLKREKPDAGDAQSGEVIETSRQPFKVADAITVRIHERFNIEIINHRIFVPEIINHASSSPFIGVYNNYPILMLSKSLLSSRFHLKKICVK
jgi:hypothetical protein